ncbi:DUF6644 family protein [Orrella sp. JC864]|uniref:DUF6644 family protein n=1 Tax=Orrella sp. JC864 TaxID=3120298 RepID=UPI0030096934
MQPLWDALAALPPAVWLQRSGTAYLLVNAAHILSLGVLVGSIVALDLRLLGRFAHAPAALLAPLLSRLAAWGLGLAAATGLWLFIVQPAEYAGNPAFLAKLAWVAAGVLNAGCLHRTGAWAALLQGGPIQARLRVHACISLLAWVAAVVAGRWIGFL